MARTSIDTMRAREDRWFEMFRQTGDPRAVAKVFDRLNPELWRIARHIARDQQAAEDAVQDTFLSAIEQCDRWDGDRPLLPWLLGILTNRIRNQRRQAARSFEPDRITQPQTEDPVLESAGRELRQLFESALLRVPEPSRTTLHQHLVEQRTAGDIADRLNIPAATVRMRVHRGLKHIRRRLPQGAVPAMAIPAAMPKASLAAMRRVVLKAAAGHGPVALVATKSLTSTLAVVTMKKTLLATSLAMAAALTVLVLPILTASSEVALADPAQFQLDLAASDDGDADIVDATAGSQTGRQLVATSDAAGPGNGTLRVVLTDADRGGPVADVRLLIQKPATTGWRNVELPMPVVTDAAGTAAMVLAAGPTRIRAESVGLEDGVECDVPEGRTAVLRIDLHRRVALDITVRNPDGSPAAGASIMGWTSRDRDRTLDGSHHGIPTERLLGRCDDRGRLQISLPDTTLEVRAAANPHAQSAVVRVNRCAKEMTLHLLPGGATLEGTVFDANNNPMPDSVVLIQQEANTVHDTIRVLTDAAGRYRCEGVAPGNCQVHAVRRSEAASYLGHTPMASATATAVLVAGQVTTTDVTFSASGAIELVLTEASGQPCTDQEVCLVPMSSAMASAVAMACVRYASTDSNGRLLFTDVPAGEYELQTNHEGNLIHIPTQMEAAGRVVLQHILAADGWIEVAVQSPDGTPLAGWTVKAAPADGGIQRAETTDRVGLVRFAGLAPGDYRITCMSSPDGLAFVERQVAANRRTSIQIPVTVEDLATVRGSLLAADAIDPQALSAQLELMPKDETSRPTLTPRRTLDSSRSFLFTDLPPGRYRMRIYHEGVARNIESFDLTPGEGRDLGEIQLGKTRVLRIRGERSSGESVDGLRVAAALTAEGGAAFTPVRTRQQDGWTLLHGVPATELELLVWGKDIAPTTARPSLRSGDDNLDDLVLTVEPAAEVHFVPEGPSELEKAVWTFLLADGRTIRERNQGRQVRGLPVGQHTLVLTVDGREVARLPIRVDDLSKKTVTVPLR
jgi:RNA polymerase sigma-70 factor (ECF subfamily)